MRVQNSGGLALLVLLLIGAIFGSIIGAALGGILPILAYGKTIGVDPFVVDLSILQMTFGLKLSLNLSGIIGLFLAFVIYRKL
ncbi:DUF4321 domain-containing protein [Fusibacter paucivorans]|uniref:DUF4321 domain-containing protein n=1 Tax=Fusibacter paucivorans TaxID=76009 RepID=A0ABS5PNU2_9FIRM|nr:DUF4321 domain-containing protein [Fusibacter paucivorans]MBS7526838.1 DUF4321 domain-containing protein [Fusibacter paucivorans]